jgi:hypothetical protein
MFGGAMPMKIELHGYGFPTVYDISKEAKYINIREENHNNIEIVIRAQETLVCIPIVPGRVS